MNIAQSLWASLQGDPKFMRKLNGWLTIFWIFMIPVSLFFGWLDSVVYVSALSLWALVAGHWSTWQAARVEVAQERALKDQAEQDLPGEVVERLVQETSVEPIIAEAHCPTCSCSRESKLQG